MQGLWLYLHFPQLQLDSLLKQQTQEEAVIIVETSRMQVVQMSPAAYESGIRKHMNLGAAAALCEALQVLPYEEKSERDTLKEIAHHLYHITSDISFSGPSGLLIRAHTMLNLYQGLKHYWLALQHQLTALEFTYHYATGHTPLAAKLLALQGWHHISDDNEKITSALKKCALRLTDLDNKSVQKLNRIGIQHLGELMAIPLPDIAKRFSHDMADYLGRVMGLLPHPVSFYHPEPHFHHYKELLYEITDSQRLLTPITHLLDALERFLRLRDKLTTQICFTLHLRDAPELSVYVGAQQGEYRAAMWKNLVSLQLEKLSLTAPVTGMTLHAEKAYIRQPERPDLFTTKQGELSRLQLLSMLQAKVGENAVFSPRLGNDHRPEKHSLQVNSLNTPASAVSAYPLRPSFLLPHPVPLTEKVTIEHGPERIQTGWWDDAPAERDYFIARNHAGQWYWVFRTPQQQWYLHGIFS
ncbi:DNA polymerase Y family protein [Alteromonas sediminis]|uniref:DNA polymerase Y family protein n=1 Tax=Alteromonas sediminis TaxID=2259342 RepID=A0A3N5YQX6_9ALTE|nr:DNA polymerase Y family protein [Alteromonas sediminis]RPJ68701.1 DNA polymerase Y family protein [Alteromonas sediminis]